MSPFSKLILILPALALGACTTAPPPVVDASHPASAAAPESRSPRRQRLAADDLTTHTHELLKQREAEAEAAEAEPKSPQ